LLKFPRIEEKQTSVEVHSRIARINSQGETIKEGYPLGYGVDLNDITGSMDTVLQHCFGTQS
jgi:hypothetical protein